MFVGGSNHMLRKIFENIKKIFFLNKPQITFSGHYTNWETAKKDAEGFESEEKLMRVVDAARKVKNGLAKYERDGICLDKSDFSFPVLTGFLLATIKSGSSLSVLDFGGALGSSYHHYRCFFNDIKEFQWSIVEIKKIVQIGKSEFEHDSLHFFYSFEECVIKQKPNVVFFSSVLQYIPNPYELLDLAFKSNSSTIIIDRTPFHHAESDRICIQNIHWERSKYFNGNYACWIFSLEKFKKYLEKQECKFLEFDSLDNSTNYEYTHKGFIIFI